MQNNPRMENLVAFCLVILLPSSYSHATITASSFRLQLVASLALSVIKFTKIAGNPHRTVQTFTDQSHVLIDPDGGS
jgi:hypothetical protein